MAEIGEYLLELQVEQDHIRRLWDDILNILLERVNDKAIPVSQLRHVTEELRLVLFATKGRSGLWASVIDVVLLLLKEDATIHVFRNQLPYNESTVYRALRRLELAGFATSMKSENSLGLVWTINKERCPVLYRASRY
jgi:hypothetical protein